MACNASQGAQARLAIEQAAAITSSAYEVEFTNESIEQIISIVNSDGVRGTRSLHSNRTRDRAQFVQGEITTHPSPADLDVWLPMILGAAASGDTFALAETIPAVAIAKYLDGEYFDFTGCHVNRAIFQSQAGGLVELKVQFMGTTEDATPSSWVPAGGMGSTAADQPYVHSDSTGALVLASDAIAMMNWRLTIDNGIDMRFTNSLTPTSLCPTTRSISLEFTLPFNSADEVDVYTDGTTAKTGTLTFTNGSVSTLFTFPALHQEPQTPKVQGKREITNYVKLVAYETDAAKELVVTNDATV